MNNAEEFINKITGEYIEKHKKEQEVEELIGENNRINQDRTGYHGREIFELLQNADDAYQNSLNEGKEPDEELEVSISYKNSELIVNNTGTFFDKDGIRAIVQGNNSTKGDDERYIGNKGIGFRSLLNWATKIIIHSGEYHVEFSEEIAQEKFNEIKNCEQIKKQLKKNKNLYIPMFAVPKYISNCEFNNKTSIEITIDTEKDSDDYSAKKQLEDIDIRILLFLPNIRKIKVNIDNDELIYEKNIKENDIVELKKYINEEYQFNEEFFLYTPKGNKSSHKDTEKAINLAIAVPVNFNNFKAAHLYSFFPLLDTHSAFNCIFHANYELGANRNTIGASERNKKIIREQLNFLIEIAEIFIANHDFEKAYNILLPIRSEGFFSQFRVEEDYFNKLSSSKIFPTVNNKLFSVEDNPLFIEGNYPTVFVGEPFSRLLRPFENESGKDLLKKMRSYKNISIDNNETALLEAINASSKNWSDKERVEVFVWWNKTYEKSLPHYLIKTYDGRFLEYKEECYFMEGNSAKLEFPSWVKKSIIDESYQKLLYDFAKKDPKVINKKEQSNDDLSRIISQSNIFPCVDFKYRDIHTIISTIKDSVDCFDKAVDFVNWLWSNYSDKENLHLDKLNFPCIKNGEKSFSICATIFLGKDYENELGEELFCSDNRCVFPDKHHFKVSTDGLYKFIPFIKMLGVKQYPVIELKDLEDKDLYSTYSMNYKNDIAKKENTYFLKVKFKLSLIDNLSNILQTVSTENIIKWISNDKALFGHLSNPYESNGAEIKYIKTNTRQSSFRSYDEKIKNYILEIFNSTKWIKIGEKKFSPRDILFYSNTNTKFVGFVPVIVEEDTEQNYSNESEVLIIDKLSKEIRESSEKVKEVLNLFDFRKQVTDLSSDKFYEILLNIPNSNEKRGKELCRAIYRIVEQSNFAKNYEESEKKKLFFNEGKMFVRFQGKEQFYLAQGSILPSNTIFDKKNYPIVVKGSRTNNENFKRVFGCQEYKRTYEIDMNNIVESEANKCFQVYFNEFKKYVKAFDDRNANLREHGNKLRITLVKSIPIKDKEDGVNNIEIDEYAYINSSLTNWYIKITSGNFDIMKVSFSIKDIYENVANTSGFEADSEKIRALFNEKNDDNRKLLIENEFGSLDVIADKDYIEMLEENFIETVKKINPKYDVKQISLDYYDFTETNFGNSKKIIDILKSLHIDLEQFNKNGFSYNINLKPYFMKQLKDFIHDNEDNYISMLYSKAFNDEELQKSFLTDIRVFKNFTGQDNITNSVNVCIVDMIKENFPVWDDENSSKNIRELYQNNYSCMNPDNLYPDEISNNEDVQRMIYFYKKEEFEKWINEMNEKRKLQYNVNDVENTKYSTIIPEEQPIKYSIPKKQRENDSRGFSPSFCYVKSEDEKKRQKQKEQGNSGELLIYNLLCRRYGKNNVFPKSEAFVELKIIPAGQAESAGYDIEYKDNDKKYFVEVKTGHDNTFFITPNELKFAKENWERYKLFYVFNLDKDVPDYHELPQNFWENTSKYTCKEIVERIKVQF